MDGRVGSLWELAAEDGLDMASLDTASPIIEMRGREHVVCTKNGMWIHVEEQLVC